MSHPRLQTLWKRRSLNSQCLQGSRSFTLAFQQSSQCGLPLGALCIPLASALPPPGPSLAELKTAHVLLPGVRLAGGFVAATATSQSPSPGWWEEEGSRAVVPTSPQGCVLGREPGRAFVMVGYSSLFIPAPGCVCLEQPSALRHLWATELCPLPWLML